MPDVQNFDGVIFYTVSDNMGKPLMQQFACAFFAPHAATVREIFQ